METIQPQEEYLDQDNISNTFQEGDYIDAKISRYEWCMAKVTKVYPDTKKLTSHTVVSQVKISTLETA
jgi:hypothetical protein